MDTTTNTTHRSRRRGGLLLALVAALALLVAACDVPAKPAGALYDAWKAGDKAKAGQTATPTAVNQLFTKTWSASSQWLFINCDGAAGSTYCTWVESTEGRLQLRVDNASQKVTSVTRIPLGNGAAGRFFHAWRVGKKDAAMAYGSASATNAMFAHSDVGAHWLPTGCDGAAGSTYCSWIGDDSVQITLRVDNATQKVIHVDRGTVD
ncbi:hypothetical protein KSP35_11025 [Aquihabitans sp. G128]|uniref:hypothetical protein n=1 Tax=Aquihabitans sp. G128 TaxID=2849779 RepID=UPI001C23237B|nr:hypothetical protein [Aquihabitans sp. G128]QXC63264.1 hypothetical protein KSP35_11025 [Aquihabitans sp. G128]